MNDPLILSEAKPLKPKAPVLKQVPWWHRQIAHPLSDEQFVAAFCQYVFETTSDHSVAIARTRAFKFISNFMNPELQRELDAYRKEFPR